MSFEKSTNSLTKSNKSVLKLWGYNFPKVQSSFLCCHEKTNKAREAENSNENSETSKIQPFNPKKHLKRNRRTRQKWLASGIAHRLFCPRLIIKNENLKPFLNTSTPKLIGVDPDGSFVCKDPRAFKEMSLKVSPLNVSIALLSNRKKCYGKNSIY